jgi:thiol-disulfide isomerase/thioredoxin
MKTVFSFIFTFLIASAVVSQESMTFQAEIANKNSESLYIKDNQSVIQEIKTDSKGNFKATFVVKEGLYQMFDGLEYAQLYLKNGFDLKLKMDAAKFDETIMFSGKGSAENNFLAQSTLLDSKINFELLLKSDEVDFKKQTDEMKANDLLRLQNGKLDPAFVALQKQMNEGKMTQLEQYYAMSLANRKMNNVSAPNFEYENYSGGKTTLESMKGKYVYIDVWATWCGPCRGEIPFLKTVEEKYKGKNIEFVSISVDEDKNHDKWKNFVADKQLGGVQLFADKNWLSDFIRAFNINSIPRFILIDPKGVVIDADASRPSSQALGIQLDKLLN